MAQTLSSISLTDLQALVNTVAEAQRKELKEKNKDVITSMQQIRMHIKRLDTIFPWCNHDLLWKDRVCAAIGLSQEALRDQLYESRVRHKSGKCSVSFYESINYNPSYLDIAIRIIEEMNEERGIYRTVYRQEKMTIKEREIFNISNVTNMSNEECTQWYNDRISDVAKMCCCDIEKATKFFMQVLIHNCEPYNPRIYKDAFADIGHEFNPSGDKAIIYNCENFTPIWGIPRVKVREYMVIAARDCLVL